MNKFKFYFIVLCAVFTLFSCNKADDDIAYEQLRYYGPQYETELKTIEDYLKAHYIKEVVNDPGTSRHQDIIIDLIPDNNTTTQSIFDSPMLHFKEVLYSGVTYKVYYITANEGTDDSPSRVDQILPAYEGSFLEYKSVTVVERNPDGTPVLDLQGNEKTKDVTFSVNTQFELVQNPAGFIPLDQTILGWREIFPLFKNGTIEAAEGPNPAIYNDFGSGVMFIPSALAYYNTRKESIPGVSLASIPSYSPLVFHFKLYDVKRADQDGDGILSNDEDLNHDGIFTNDDTDGDGRQNFLDIDDDGDGYLTKSETKYTDPEGSVRYYPFNGALADDPLTPFDESQGVPDCSGNFTDSARLRKYLDKTCH